MTPLSTKVSGAQTATGVVNALDARGMNLGPFRLPRKEPHGGLFGSSSSSSSSPATHPDRCLCCIGPPDDAFERACASLVALNVTGVGALEAEKFVRLCRASDGMRLSRSKYKAATKLRRHTHPLEADAMERMQAAVLGAYDTTLALERAARAIAATAESDDAATNNAA